MKRRKFLEQVSLSAAGIGLISSCTGEIKSSGNVTGGLADAQTPGYRTKIKSSFAGANTRKCQ